MFLCQLIRINTSNFVQKLSDFVGFFFFGILLTKSAEESCLFSQQRVSTLSALWFSSHFSLDFFSPLMIWPSIIFIFGVFFGYQRLCFHLSYPWKSVSKVTPGSPVGFLWISQTLLKISSSLSHLRNLRSFRTFLKLASGFNPVLLQNAAFWHAKTREPSNKELQTQTATILFSAFWA